MAVVAIFCIVYYDTAIYGFRQAKGQLKVIFNTKPVDEVLQDKTFPDSLKKRILLIQEIKKFAVDSLGLNPSDNYTTFYDQHGKPILWVMTASEPFELKAKTWNFPILGKFSYKGHFEKAIADSEIAEMKKAGLDTRLNEVSAWSTLGYLKDPILSSMLTYSDGRLAELIIHELTHGTLFAKNNLEFNENLADFVGNYGAVEFLKYKYGKNSEQLAKHLYGKQYNDAFSKHLLRGATQLDSLYQSKAFRMQPLAQKKHLKDEKIKEIFSTTDTLLNNTFSKKIVKKKKWLENLPNNAYFIGFLTYESKQNSFENEFRTKFNSDFGKYLAYLKIKYPTIGKSL